MLHEQNRQSLVPDTRTEPPSPLRRARPRDDEPTQKMEHQTEQEGSEREADE